MRMGNKVMEISLGIYWPNLVGNLCTYIKYIYVVHLSNFGRGMAETLKGRFIVGTFFIFLQSITKRWPSVTVSQPPADFKSSPAGHLKEKLMRNDFLVLLSSLYRRCYALEIICVSLCNTNETQAQFK